MNFCVNRTTAERFSRASKAKTKKIAENAEDESEVKEGEGQVNKKASENILKLYDEMPDFSSKSCGCIHNEYEMMFPSHTPN